MTARAERILSLLSATWSEARDQMIRLEVLGLDSDYELAVATADDAWKQCHEAQAKLRHSVEAKDNRG